MMKSLGSLYNQAVLSPVGMEVYLLQVLVARGDESVGAASKRKFDP